MKLPRVGAALIGSMAAAQACMAQVSDQDLARIETIVRQAMGDLANALSFDSRP